MEAVLRQVPGLRDVTNTAALGSPELRVTIDEARAQDLGVTAAGVGQAIRASYAGGVPTKFRRADGKLIDVRVVLDERTRAQTASIVDLPIPTASGSTIRLGQVASVQSVDGPSQIERRGRQRLANLTASVAPDSTLGEVMPRAQAAISSVTLPPRSRPGASASSSPRSAPRSCWPTCSWPSCTTRSSRRS
jgi:hydrophobic/amphiphilic exporter-1 (mainly G- bacteria), HAE1 family